jgi:hypothetical protein
MDVHVDEHNATILTFAGAAWKAAAPSPRARRVTLFLAALPRPRYGPAELSCTRI